MEKRTGEKGVLKAIYVISALVFGVVVVLYMLPERDTVPEFARFLPSLNAVINGTCFALLLTSLYFIKKGKVQTHKKLNIITFILSSCFLISYILFHSFGIETKFPEDNTLRPVYIAILLTHIVLAAVVLPLILISFYYGLKGMIDKHKKIVKWSFPIWLYVTASGVVVYLMISPYYSF